jgi:hypothetical protein
MADYSCVAVERAQGERMKDRAALVAMLAKPQKMWSTGHSGTQTPQSMHSSG